ncbi:hypothetical protein ACEPAF_1727 [Sanghuangporus sanghuang]
MSCTHRADSSSHEHHESFFTCCSFCDRDLYKLNVGRIERCYMTGVLKNTFSREALAYGIGKLKYPDDDTAASGYSFDWADVLPEVESRKERFLNELASRDSQRPLGCRIGELFNEIGTAVRERLGIPQNPFSAEFTCQFAFPESREDVSRVKQTKRPELALVEHHSLFHGGLLSWKTVKVPVVFAQDVGGSDTVLKKLLSSAVHIWSNQGYRRRFVMGIGIYDKHFELTCFNRSGIMFSEDHFNSHTMNLARLIFGLLFSDAEYLGYDPSVLFDRERSTLVNQKTYSRKVFCGTGGCLFGSDAACTLAVRSGELYAIKDVWLDYEESIDGPPEVQILRMISDVENVARLVDHEQLKARNGSDDSTNPFWEGDDDDSYCLPARFHHRYVIKPVGTHLDSFVSLEEIISAIRDVVKVIKDLLDRRILHGDISFHNVILAPNAESPTSLRRGCVIDFADAIQLDYVDYNIEYKIKTTPWFCPQELAYANSKRARGPTERSYRQDLESTLYLLCFVCIALDGPDENLDLGNCFKRPPLSKWERPTSPGAWDVAYRDRAEALESRWRFKEKILAHFQPYFEDLKTTALKMYDLLFPDVLRGVGKNNVEQNLKKLKESLTESEAETEPDSDGAEKKCDIIRQIKDCEKRLAVRPLDEQSSDEVFDKMFAILDGTLDTLRQKSSANDTDTSSAERKVRDRDSEIDFILVASPYIDYHVVPGCIPAELIVLQDLLDLSGCEKEITFELALNRLPYQTEMVFQPLDAIANEVFVQPVARVCEAECMLQLQVPGKCAGMGASNKAIGREEGDTTRARSPALRPNKRGMQSYGELRDVDSSYTNHYEFSSELAKRVGRPTFTYDAYLCPGGCV